MFMKLLDKNSFDDDDICLACIEYNEKMGLRESVVQSVIST